jgi:transcriptional regulator with XRE-family HTH domain
MSNPTQERECRSCSAWIAKRGHKCARHELEDYKAPEIEGIKATTPDIELCKGCGMAKHVNANGLCGRCVLDTKKPSKLVEGGGKLPADHSTTPAPTNTDGELPKLVRELRGKRSQTEFGKLFGVSHAAVSDWERGISDVPGVVTLALIAQEVSKARIDELRRNAYYSQPYKSDPLKLSGIEMTANQVNARIAQLTAPIPPNTIEEDKA